VGHHLAAADGAWDSPTIQPGQGFGRAFPTAGTFSVVLLDTPSVTATVTVS
jgi:hypothetical protein